MAIGSFICIIGAVLQAAGTSLGMLMGGRFILGLGAVLVQTSGPAYVVEMAVSDCCVILASTHLADSLAVSEIPRPAHWWLPSMLLPWYYRLDLAGVWPELHQYHIHIPVEGSIGRARHTFCSGTRMRLLYP